MSILIFHHFQYRFSPVFYTTPLTLGIVLCRHVGRPPRRVANRTRRHLHSPKTLPGEFLGTPLALTTVGLPWTRETRCRDIDGGPSRGRGRPSCGTSGRTDGDVYRYDCGWEVEAQVVVKYANVHYFTDARDEFAARLDPALLFHIRPPTSHSSEASPMTVMRLRASMGSRRAFGSHGTESGTLQQRG
jgi:hypothetical protein